VSFIDDYSRRTWVYFLITKSNMFSQFKEFKALMENQTSRKIKVLRTDNGGEFFFANLEICCKENDIEIH
jgi:hypothetical protein